MRYLFILALLFMGCVEDSTSPDMTEECNCPTNETTADEACRLFTDEDFTDNDCLEYCEIDQVDEGFISACTECLVDDDCDDALETYSECTSCLESCEIESTQGPEYCSDYCDFLHCVGPYETCTTDPDNMFCTIDCENVVGGDDFSCFDDAFQDEEEEDDSDDGAETCDECLEDCDDREEPWEVDSCIDFCNETICW